MRRLKRLALGLAWAYQTKPQARRRERRTLTGRLLMTTTAPGVVGSSDRVITSMEMA